EPRRGHAARDRHPRRREGRRRCIQGTRRCRGRFQRSGREGQANEIADSSMRSTDSYEFSCDPARLDVDAIHDFLSQSYWAAAIPRSVVERSCANSLCFGVYCDGAQVGLARMITDKATFAYLADVYILPEHRAKGLAQRLLREILRHPELQGLRRILLFTRD